MAAVSTGTTCLFGINGTVTNLFVQSYTVNATFNLSGTVADETGLTKTARYDDRKTEITVDGICKTATMPTIDRKSTRLNSSHLGISYAVFCLKKKKTH